MPWAEQGIVTVAEHKAFEDLAAYPCGQSDRRGDGNLCKSTGRGSFARSAIHSVLT